MVFQYYSQIDEQRILNNKQSFLSSRYVLWIQLDYKTFQILMNTTYILFWWEKMILNFSIFVKFRQNVKSRSILSFFLSTSFSLTLYFSLFLSPSPLSLSHRYAPWIHKTFGPFERMYEWRKTKFRMYLAFLSKRPCKSQRGLILAGCSSFYQEHPEEHLKSTWRAQVIFTASWPRTTSLRSIILWQISLF